MARWKFDQAHSGASFEVRHMMVTKVRGTFSNLEGWLEFDEANPSDSQIVAEIPVDSISTHVEDRDNHLRSPDFFDVANYPTMTFKSTKVEVTGDDSGRVTGDLTIRGVTREVTFDLEYFGQITSLYGDERAGFSGKAKINREDFGLTWNQALETGGVLVGKDVEINVELQAIKEVAAESI